MIPLTYCEPVRYAEWHEVESWKDTEDSTLDLRARLQFIDLWTALSKNVDAEGSRLAKLFQQHAETWERETMHLSSTTKRVMHPSYQSIIGMGPQIVPYLLKDLQSKHRIWFWALVHITGENPTKPEDAGDVAKMADSWIEWGKGRGLV